MPTTTNTTRKSARPVRSVSKPQKIAQSFLQWLETRKQDDLLKARIDDLRLGLLDDIAEIGETDEKGHVWVDLPQPIEFEHVDKSGKKKVVTYTSLKREKRVSTRVPDADLAEDLLRNKGLWLTEKQEKLIRDVQGVSRFARIVVEVDTEALVGAVFQGLITDDEYEEVLVPERVTYAFQPATS